MNLKNRFKKNLPLILAGISGAIVGGLIMYNKTALFKTDALVIGTEVAIKVNKLGRITNITAR